MNQLEGMSRAKFEAECDEIMNTIIGAFEAKGDPVYNAVSLITVMSTMIGDAIARVAKDEPEVRDMLTKTFIGLAAHTRKAWEISKEGDEDIDIPEGATIQ